MGGVPGEMGGPWDYMKERLSSICGENGQKSTYKSRAEYSLPVWDKVQMRGKKKKKSRKQRGGPGLSEVSYEGQGGMHRKGKICGRRWGAIIQELDKNVDGTARFLSHHVQTTNTQVWEP